MKGKHFLLLASIFSGTSVWAAPQIQSLEVADPAALQRELAAVRRAPESPERFVKEARLLFFTGQSEKSPDTKASTHDQGAQMAQKAIDAEPESSAAWIWWGANTGAVAETRKNVASLSKVKDVEKAFQKVLKKDPDFGFAAPDRALGRLYQKAPSFISIGSMSKAGKHFQAALSRHPQYLGNLIFMADYLKERDDDGDLEEARALAKKVLESPELAKSPQEAPEWIKIAREILPPKGS